MQCVLSTAYMDDLSQLKSVFIRLGIDFIEEVDHGWCLPEEFCDADDFPMEVIQLHVGSSAFYFSIHEHGFLGWADLERSEWHPRKWKHAE